MISEIEQHRREIEALCREYGVERLALVGSAATGDFRANSSDLDFLVEFRTPRASGYANRYFGLLESLQTLFNRPIDLIVESASGIPTSAKRWTGTRRCCIDVPKNGRSAGVC